MECASGAKVEEVEEVRGAGDDPAGDDGVDARLPPRCRLSGAEGVEESVVATVVGAEDRGGDDRGDGDAGDLDRPGGDLSVGEGAEVTAQALRRPGLEEVVDGAEDAGDRGREQGGRRAADLR